MHKLVPPFLFLFCILGMFLLNRFYPIQGLLPEPYHLLGIIPLGLGLLMLFSTLKKYRKVRTQIHTFKKPKKFITDGFFRYSRNPIYLGFTLSLMGIALLFGNVTPLLPVAFFFLIANFWYIPFEEKNMELVFGDNYLSYKKKVRRWL